MRSKRRFMAGSWEELETRVVLSAGVRHSGALIRKLNDVPVATRPQAQKASVLISAAYQQFNTAYSATLNQYLTPPNNASMAGQTAFTAAVYQEVNLLSQNLIRSMLPVNGATQRQPHSQPPIQAFINNRILGTSPTSLWGGLKTAVPPVGTTTANDQLYVTIAQSAINASQVSVQNALRIFRLGAFNGHH